VRSGPHSSTGRPSTSTRSPGRGKRMRRWSRENTTTRCRTTSPPSCVKSGRTRSSRLRRRPADSHTSLMQSYRGEVRPVSVGDRMSGALPNVPVTTSELCMPASLPWISRRHATVRLRPGGEAPSRGAARRGAPPARPPARGAGTPGRWGRPRERRGGQVGRRGAEASPRETPPRRGLRAAARAARGDGDRAGAATGAPPRPAADRRP
jgi:hypothetical protein